MRLEKGRFANYCYIIVDATRRRCVVVDPAWNEAAFAEVFADRGVDLAGILLTHHHFDHVHLAEPLSRTYGCPIYVSEAEHNYYQMRFEDAVLLQDDAPVDVGGLRIRPLVTPGHTVGSTCFSVGDFLFTGDTLFNEGCGACSGDGANPVQLYFSLRRLRRAVPGHTRVFPGHRFHSDLGATFDEVCAMNVYLQFQRVDAFVGYRMRGGQTRNLDFL